MRTGTFGRGVLTLATFAATIGLGGLAHADSVECPAPIQVDILTTGQQWAVTGACDVALAGATSVRIGGSSFLPGIAGANGLYDVHVTLIDKATGDVLAECHDTSATPLAEFQPDPIGGGAHCNASASFESPTDVDATCVVSGNVAGTYSCSASN